MSGKNRTVPCVVLGLLLLFASPLVERLLVGRLSWGHQDALRLQQAAQQYHHAMHAQQHGAVPPGDDVSAELATAAYRDQQAAFDGVLRRGNWARHATYAAGLLAIAAGIWFYFLEQFARTS